MINKWAIGVTIAPRDIQTYDRTLDCIIDNGWEPYLFCEPGVELLPKYQKLPHMIRPRKYGAWKNCFHSLACLYEFYPDAECYGLFEDDVILCKGAKTFLSKTLWPANDCAFASIYSPDIYTNDNIGYYECVKDYLWGGLAYFFSNTSIKKFIKNSYALRYNGIHKDITLGKWAKQVKLKPYYFSPSLAQHIGETSTIWGPDSKIVRGRQASDFVGMSFNAEQLTKYVKKSV